MTFEVTVLGSNSALPVHGRHPTSQVINIYDHHFLVDCGEGTQIQFGKYDVKFGKINHIFISHLHGDHYFGLIGLLTSYSLNHRETPMTIFAPPGLKDILQIHFDYTNSSLSFPVNYIEIKPINGQLIFENEFMEVTTVEMIHRLPCCGFVFKEKLRDRNIIADKIEEFNIPYSEIPKIKKGADFVTESGKVIENASLTIAPPKPRIYAFCTDTAYNEEIIPHISGAELLYHEATFSKDQEERAKETYHSTSLQAALIAKKANVKKLIIGHYSARFKNNELHLLKDEALTVFPNADLAIEGTTYIL